MASTGKTGYSSPSVASAFLPLGRQRRGSVISVASNMDKDTLNHALDHIHRAASGTDRLTTFNDFTPPPSSGLARDGLGFASDIQGSLTGLYGRLKATVGGLKDGSGDQDSTADGADDASSLRSERTAGSGRTPSSRYGPRKKRNPSPAMSNLSLVVKPRNGSDASTDAAEPTIPKGDAGREHLHVKTTSSASNSISMTDQPAAVKAVAGLKPFKSPVAGVSETAIVETNVVAEKGQSNLKSLSIATSQNQSLLTSQASDAVEMLKATDKRLSRGRTVDGESQKRESAPTIMTSAEVNVERHPETPKVTSQRPSAPSSSKDIPVTPPEKIPGKQIGDVLQAQHMSEQGIQKPESQARAPFLSLVRGHSTSSTAVSIASTTRHFEEHQEEAVHALGRLPSHVPSNSTHAKSIQTSTTVLTNMKKRVLSREYWMRDENAKDCFYCGDLFTTWRRKHHCRTCGQIFDAKCTTLVNGAPFGQSGTIRVCKPCEGIINGYDDSSEFSDDASISSGFRPRHGSTSAHELSPARSFASLRAIAESKGDSIPSISIPTRRVPDASKRRSAIIEIDAEPRLARPASARSLKPSLLMRPPTSGHKRYHSKQLWQRGPRMEIDEPAPFHIQSTDSPRVGHRLSAFHSDSVIDPDLAAYLSDEASSENEQLNLVDALSNDTISKSGDNDKGGLQSLSASSRRRSRFAEKSISGITSASRDADNISLSSARLGRSRSLKRRTQSIASNLHLRGSPRVQRYSVPLYSGISQQQDAPSTVGLDNNDSPVPASALESNQADNPSSTAAELNAASVQHVRRLLLQLLKRFEVGHIRTWEKALMPVILQASNDVVPDVQHGDAIDVRHYIKLKKIPGGRPGDSSLVSGLVFTKNLALKSMPRTIPSPNILILTFPLEYARHQKHFMSLEPVIRQEQEYLQNLVHRIAALKPHLLLVHRNISGLALQFLEQARIATAYNVKLSVLEAISRCAQTRIITSIDKLAIKPAQAGRCAAFYLKTYKYKNRRKTYMYLSGCPRELGCTIVLRGGDEIVLSKIKRITEFMTYVTYNLKLETSFMRDEFAQMPSYQDSGTIVSDEARTKNVETSPPKTAGLPQKKGIEQIDDASFRPKDSSSKLGHLEVMSVHDKAAYASQLHSPQSNAPDDINLPDDTPMPTFYGDMIEQHQDRVLSCSPFVRFGQPYLVTRAREQERRLVYLKQLRDQDHGFSRSNPSEKAEKFMLITPDMIHATTEHAPSKVREVIRAVQDAEYDKAVHNYRTQKKQWEAYVAGSGDMFDPLLHQNIAVLYSIVCATTSVPCIGPEVLALGFYNEHETDENFDADVTLGQYVEDLCLGARSLCTANACDRQMMDHHRQYVHGDAQLSVTIESQETKLRGFENVVLMWSVCRICEKETPVIPMSDNTWKYSFGKYLELSFWGNDLHARAGLCEHSLHRDYHRFFGFKNLAVRIQYDSITLLEIIVPRTRITWKVTNDLRFKNEVFTTAEERINRFMNSVNARINSIRLESVIPEKAGDCKEVIDKLTKLSQEHHTFLTHKLQEKYMDSNYYEVVPLNRAVRALQEKVVEWDGLFAEFDRDFFPSDKDIRRLATLQLKKLFLDREDSMTSVSSADEKNTSSMASSILTEPSSPEETPILISPTRTMSPKKAHDVLNAVVEDNLSPEPGETKSPLTALKVGNEDRVQDNGGSPQAKEMQHLDLAVSEDVLARTASQQSSPAALNEDSVKTPTSQSTSHTSNEMSPVMTSSVQSLEDHHISKPQGEAAISGQTLPEQHSPRVEQSSGPSRPSDRVRRKSIQRSSIPLYRAQSQPAHLRRDKSSSSSGHGSGSGNIIPLATHTEENAKHHDQKILDRAGLGPTKRGIHGHSMIPRSVANRKKESKVSTLAKHFEELSREFERERLRDRRQRASTARQARAYPVAASKPMIEEYRNFHEAVAEKDPSDEQSTDIVQSEGPEARTINVQDMAHVSRDPSSPQSLRDGDITAEDTAAETTENEEQTADSRASSEDEDDRKDEKDKATDGIASQAPETQVILNQAEAQLDVKLDLPKHEKTSLMKMLTNFWAERSASGWQPLEYPLNPTDHIFADSDIIVREDEPSSLIAFALDAADYKAKLAAIQEKSAKYELQDRQYVEDLFLTGEDQARIERSLLQSTGTHLKYQFQEGSARMQCKIFYAEQFEAVRRKCGIDFRFIESLSRCLKWDSKGGKTKSVFLKTLDDRLVLKSLSQIETQAFLRFAPSYFTLMGEALFHELPSVIAKMVGFYQIIAKNPATGVEFNWFLLAMENLFYDRTPTRIFDLKGSMRNRRIQSTGERNEVLLDENMVEYIYEKPLFAREHSKRLLRASVYNDTLFLARQNVMDYSLMVAIDEQRKELVVGIIDCIRTYTWDKKLESWIKGGKNRPTVTSPKEYKNRFREAMSRYVLQAPT